MLDSDNDGEISLQEFVAGFDKFCNIRDGGAANFNSGPVQQWGFQKWKLDRWLAFDGKVISVYKCPGKPEAGVKPKYTIPMDISVCFKDPTNSKRFSIDTGFSMVHFRYEPLSHKSRTTTLLRELPMRSAAVVAPMPLVLPLLSRPLTRTRMAQD